MLACGFYKWTLLLGLLQMSVQITTSSTEQNIPKNTLYFGWFFSESISTSLETITKGYLKQAYDAIPEVSEFLTNLSRKQNISDPLQYYTKPVDPVSGKFDPLYHVTAMYCGSRNCSSYYDKIKNSLNKMFEMSLIGVFFTNTTIGIRVSLTQRQHEMTDEYPENSLENLDSYRIKKTEEYPGIKFIPQPLNFTPSTSKAHITLGAAPGIPAFQTGPDLLSIVEYENNTANFNHTEYSIPNVGTLRQYFPQDAEFQNETLAFVYYLNSKMVTDSRFEVYINTTKTDSGNSAPEKAATFCSSLYFFVLFLCQFYL